MRPFCSLLCLTALSLVSAQGHAQDDAAPAKSEPAKTELSQKEQARDLYAEGSRLYDQGDFAGAIAAFEKAYAAYPAAAQLFNLAQAHRQLGPSHCKQALEYYERYRKTPESAGDREEVEVHMAEMRGCAKAADASAQQRSSQPAPAEPKPAEPPAPVKPAVAPERPIPVAAWLLGAVGIAGAATFGVFATLGKQQQSELESDCSPGCSPQRVQAMKTKYLVADISLAVGVVSLGAAGYLVLSRPSVDPARTGKLADGAQLNLVGRF